MSPIEITATIFGLACVWLTVKQNIWCWPTGLIQVILYIWIFGQAKLYSDAILQVIYVFLQIYGWWAWKRGNKGEELEITLTPMKHLLFWIPATLVATAIWGSIMARIGAAAPYADGFIAVASLVATYLMARKYVESWCFWLAVDVVAVPVYLYKHLYPTAGLYVVFLILAIIGYRGWYIAFQNRTKAFESVADYLASLEKTA